MAHYQLSNASEKFFRSKLPAGFPKRPFGREGLPRFIPLVKSPLELGRGGVLNDLGLGFEHCINVVT